MSEKEIKQMLSDLINEIDYDIYKSYFVYEDDEEGQDLSPLVEIVKKHLSKANKKPSA